MGLGSAAVVAPPAASGAFSPLSLTPALWVDPSDAATVTISGSSGAYIGSTGLVKGTSASDYTVTPTCSPLQDTAGFDLMVRMSIASWNVASIPCVIAKRGATNGWMWDFQGDTMRLWCNALNVSATVTNTAASVPTGTMCWVRCLLSGSNVSFYYAADSASIPGSWTQIGTTVAKPGAITDSGGNLNVGSFNNGSGGAWAGTVSRAVMKDSVGTTVFDADFDAATPFVSAFTESALGAPVYVVSSTATSSTASYRYIGPEGLVGTNSASNYASTAAQTATDTADFELVARIQRASWTVGDYRMLYANTSGGATGVDERMTVRLSNKTIELYWYDGAAGKTVSSSSPLTVSDGQAIWIKVTVAYNAGGTYAIDFYQAADQSAEPSSWTAVGTQRTGAQSAGTRPSNKPIYIGSWGTYVARLADFTIKRVIVRNAIGGTKVFDADFVSAADYATSFVESSASALTVTVTAANTPANAAGACVSQINDKSGNARHLTQGTLANMPKYWNGRNGNNVLVLDGSNDTLTVAGSIVSQPDSVIVAARSTSSNKHIFGGGAGAVQELYDVSGSTIRASAGLEVALAATTSNRHIYVVTFDGASSKLRSDGGAGSSGSMSTGNMTNGFRLSGNSSGSFPMAGEVQDVVIVSGAISVSDLNNLGPYMAAKANTTWTTAT